MADTWAMWFDPSIVCIAFCNANISLFGMTHAKAVLSQISTYGGYSQLKQEELGVGACAEQVLECLCAIVEPVFCVT